ncbi:DNA mismatch repair protein MutS [Thermosipho melanesiensis]|uniref:DNA mismatch repair protein MutS domain protein n=3 Tax=Thermosipho melanesiensis TaxID=46541 RepID=A6LJH1_THEM4|nr:DNA mismatch repair protein MutS [Thermosipho melanesiensis]ABR30072.1 DNA mismatch repair protein MutS domain protein [Thermosipho melanesiensis BI429]APT73269.1 DNA mismatch repair protein MutS [Thermosipho melanesiensis]OOC38663.1 DNA mismatch repair protein MutS [Thermosipho melanesiensis]OOC40467.1 DNA mismatch repair protein MutS [Thermosipho melanesiensis]OOC40732.1 DNA mismatch repair protein MutS [Thermosipho melanesiensis]
MDVGFEYIKSNLNFSSQIGRKYFENIKILTSKSEITYHLKAIEILSNLSLEKVKNILSHFQDIHETFKKLSYKNPLDEIELFQIKHFTYFSQELFNELKTLNLLDYFNLEALVEPFKILDPDNEKMPTFYIYSSYDKTLKEIRGKKQNENDENKLIDLTIKEKEIEKNICENLSLELFKYTEKFLKNYKIIGFLDFSISKLELIKKLNLKKPKINKAFEIEYQQLFNPEIKNLLEGEGKKFQDIDIKLKNGTQIITGANMGGKTLLLRTIALSQILFQMGFYVPAKEANLPIFDKIYFISGDFQNVKLGLSSFAAEMKIINEIFKQINKEQKMLILLDEPARTTNPTEGRAIVKTIANLLNQQNIICCITTHFDNVISDNIRHLRIKGVKNIEKIDKNRNIQDYFDYSLEEVSSNVSPKEAIKILKLLNIDNYLVEKIEEVLENEK